MLSAPHHHVLQHVLWDAVHSVFRLHVLSVPTPSPTPCALRVSIYISREAHRAPCTACSTCCALRVHVLSVPTARVHLCPPARSGDVLTSTPCALRVSLSLLLPLPLTPSPSLLHSMQHSSTCCSACCAAHHLLQTDTEWEMDS